VQQLIVREVERTDRAGNTTVRREIRVRLVDKVRAVKADDILAKTAHDDLQPELDKKNAQIEWLKQSVAEARERDKDIEKEVGSRVRMAMSLLFRDSVGNLFPGVTPDMFDYVQAQVTRHYPHPP